MTNTLLCHETYTIGHSYYGMLIVIPSLLNCAIFNDLE